MRHVLIADDDADHRATLAALLEQAGWAVSEAADGLEAVQSVEADPPDIVLLDLEMPRKGGLEALGEVRYLAPGLPVVILTGHGDIPRAVEAMRSGAYDFLTKPPDPDHLLMVLDRALERRTLHAEVTRRRKEEDDRYAMVGDSSPAMRSLLKRLERVVATESTVLLTGESGTGKELVARRIWRTGPRSDRSFVVVNCAALSETLLESDFFGHAKGAFTGASSAKAGRLEEADGGTLLLDEVCELPQPIQAKLLRVMEYGTFERVGETKSREVDIRIISATNRDPEEEVSAGRFREDLFHRLSVIRLHLPPLRERAGDLAEIVDHLLKQLGTELGVQAAPPGADVFDAIEAYDWPGNVRELRNVLERALVLSPDSVVEPRDIPHTSRLGESAGTSMGSGIPADLPLQDALERFKRVHVERALERFEGNQTRAAEALGMHRSSLNRLLKELNLR